MTDMADWDDDILGEDKADEVIIELTDIVNEDSDRAQDEDVIELIDIIEEGSTDLDLDIEKEEALGGEEGLELEDDPSFDQGLELEMGDPAEDESIEPDEVIELPGDLSVSQEQVEAALARVIEKKFADKIENILFEVMEKVIEKEIAEIKESLQKDLDQIGNT